MVTPRNQRYRRKINSALDLAKMAADPAGFEYEQRTKSIIETKPGFGPFNDMVNLSGVVRFGKENLDAQLAGLVKGGKAPGIVYADDVYGQKVSGIGEWILPYNEVENILTGKGTRSDVINALLYTPQGGGAAMKVAGKITKPIHRPVKAVAKPIGKLLKKTDMGLGKLTTKTYQKILSLLP